MSLADRVLAELQTQPPGVPVAVGEIADRLQCSAAEVEAEGHALERREPGDHELVTVVKRISRGGDAEVYLSRVPLALNDEPETE